MSNLNQNVKVTRVMDAVAVGLTAQNSSVIDMQGFDGVAFILLAGTITDGDLSLKIQQDTVLAFDDDAQDLLGTLATILNANDDDCAIVDIFRPRERFVRAVVVRGGATGAVIDGVLAIQYNGRKRPTVHDSATVAASESHSSPAEGTA
ncbi:hypothetical protein LCGC14_1234880 [marine sediment metagenome]|uniref:Uncharacterized protein n=1 Tax=marine sediment metagenome TaxID=412755 RepID=A0A0F9LUT8_9ZZZZ